MKQLLLFAIVGIGLVGATTGFAANPNTNIIALVTQSLGASNDQQLTSDLSAANVNFGLCQTLPAGTQLPNGLTACNNQEIAGVTSCLITDRTVGDIIPVGGTIYCKLTGIMNTQNPANSPVVAEGVFTNTGAPLVCADSADPSVNPCANLPATLTLPGGDIDVQVVHDVKIVYKGPSV